MPSAPPELVVLETAPPGVRTTCRRRDAEGEYRRRLRDSVFVVSGGRAPGWMASAAAGPDAGPPRGRLLLRGRAAPSLVSALSGRFLRVIADPDAVLEGEDLLAALTSDHPEDLCVAAGLLPGGEELVLWRGDFRPLFVTLREFRGPAAGVPDPRRIRLLDCGQTVALGRFQAAFSALLYEKDPDYRRRARRRARDEDRSYGGSIRRLRLQRGRTRGEIPGVASRTVARIEKGFVRRPHRATLAALAAALGVAVEELGTF
ncbi:MAG: helix-turn-helix domain-containing protein [Planctomycetes bacterium]|nr:helix-turn-helix domain-containing protein [Planctomycetota bacterium]